MHVNDIAFVGSVLRDAQRRRGDSSELVDPPKPGAALAWPWKWISVALRLPILASTAMKVRRGGSDIAHIHYATQALVGPILGRPYVVHCHGTDIRGVAANAARGRLLHAMFSRASLVLYSTPDLAADACRLRRDALFLPNPIDVAAFASDGARDQDLLVAVRLDPVKGAEIAISAVERILAVRPATTITVVANGSMATDARARLGERVRFVDPVAHADMPRLIARHRVALGQFHLGILSQLELEAMACGTAVVTSFRYATAYDLPPPIEEASDPSQVARFACGLLDDDDRREALAERGREWVVAHHSADAVAERLDGLYRRLPVGHP